MYLYVTRMLLVVPVCSFNHDRNHFKLTVEVRVIEGINIKKMPSREHEITSSSICGVSRMRILEWYRIVALTAVRATI